jgi:predicted ATP-grasp superfamily ATP-dependent carboligase
MKVPMSLKALAIVLAASSFGFTGSASAYDDDDRGAGVAVGILGEVIGSAVEAEQAKEAADEQERRCRRFSRKCADGESWACEKQDSECGD